MKTSPDSTPPAWALSLMNPTVPPAWAQALISPLVNSVTQIETAVSKNTACIASLQDTMKEEMNKIISPLSAEIAKVNKARSEDKAKNDTNLKNLADKLNNDIEILKAEHSAQTLEILEKVDSIQKLVTDKSTPVPNS